MLVLSSRSRAAAGSLDSALALRGGWWLLGLPFLFLHARYQPSVSVSVGSTSVDIAAADVVIGVGVLLLAARVIPFGLPRRWWLALGPAALLAALVFAGTLHGAHSLTGYETARHAVSAAKYVEYMALALVLCGLLRDRVGLLLFGAVLTAWSVVCTVWGSLQFAGVVAEFEGMRPLQREVSLVGVHDFAALSGAALALGLAALAVGTRSRWETRVAVVAGISGALGAALSASSAGFVGVALAAAAAGLVAQRRGRLSGRRAVALAAAVLVVAAGVAGLRSNDISQFFRWAGFSPKQSSTTENVQTYAQRSIVGYIALRMWLDHPLAGTGWQGSLEPAGYDPYIAAARRKFPAQPAQAFPSPATPTNPQNVYLQLLSDLGLLGLLAFLATLAGSAWLALGALRTRGAAAETGTVALLLLLVAAGVGNAIGLVAGIPLDALLWIAVGASLAAATMAERRV